MKRYYYKAKSILKNDVCNSTKLHFNNFTSAPSAKDSQYFSLKRHIGGGSSHTAMPFKLFPADLDHLQYNTLVKTYSFMNTTAIEIPTKFSYTTHTKPDLNLKHVQ